MIWAVLLEPIPHLPPSLTLPQDEQMRREVAQIAHAVWVEWTMTDSDVISHVHQSIRCLIFDSDLQILHCTGRLWWLPTAPLSFTRHNCRTLLCVSIPSVQRSVVWRDRITADQNILFSLFIVLLIWRWLACLLIFFVACLFVFYWFCFGGFVLCFLFLYYWFHFVFCFLFYFVFDWVFCGLFVFYWFCFVYVWSLFSRLL